MAHWAEINESNIVLRVIGTNNDGDEGYQWIMDNLGGKWIKTSYNTIGGVHTQGGTPLRMNYASVGYLYDPIRDAFIAPKPDPIILPEGQVIDFYLEEKTLLWKPDVENDLTEEENPFF
jgi:hypothetical protein